MTLDQEVRRLEREREDALECERLAVERVNRLRAVLKECVEELSAWNSYEPCLVAARAELEQSAATSSEKPKL